jgi:hypothetical protein
MTSKNSLKRNKNELRHPHYKTLLECCRRHNETLPNMIIDTAYISLSTGSALDRWKKASQVMIEKGKGQLVDNLCIIQLVEADLNFVLHTIWGHRLIRHAMNHKLLNADQYAIPGQTCNNAVLNKILFLDLSHQTLSDGILTDYDTTATFDRVIAGLSIVTCQRVGLPRIAGYFMYDLLKHMSFNLITGFGSLSRSFHNTQDGTTGQGVLQGSSSAAPIYILNSDISLTAFQKIGTGTAFTHPITKQIASDRSVQYVDNTSQFLNPLGISNKHNCPAEEASSMMPDIARKNAQTWADIQHISGGQLNTGKCYYYAFQNKINYKNNKIICSDLKFNTPISINYNDTCTTEIPQIKSSKGRRTLGAIISPNGSSKAQLTFLPAAC